MRPRREKIKVGKYKEVRLGRGREISPHLQQDLLRFYGFKIITRGRGKAKEEN